MIRKTYLLFLTLMLTFACGKLGGERQIEVIKHGYVSKLMATKWEESMLTGNGTIGALVLGDPNNERIVYSHEELFLPRYEPTKAPNYGEIIDEVRRLLFEGNAEEAVQLMMQAGAEAGHTSEVWPDPLIPAGQLEIENLDGDAFTDYRKSVNYETGESSVRWSSGASAFTRNVFASRADGLIAMEIVADGTEQINIRMRLARVPFADQGEELEDFEKGNATLVVEGVVKSYDQEEGTLLVDDTEFRINSSTTVEGDYSTLTVGSVVSAMVSSGVATQFEILSGLEEEDEEEEEDFRLEDHLDYDTSTIKGDLMTYEMRFKKRWERSLKGVSVDTKLLETDGEFYEDGGWLYVKGASRLVAVTKVELTYDDRHTLNSANIDVVQGLEYDSLLSRHRRIHSEMFNRYSLDLGEEVGAVDYDELYRGSSAEELNPQLVVQLMKSCRYIQISSTGKLPPALQGIWGGTWLPNWSGDFTLNGNVPSAISSGLPTNFQEVTQAYMGYMNGFFDDFQDNAREIFGAEGIFVPSRSSSSGKTHHYFDFFPHLFWFAGNSWTSQHFYDHWQFTRDEEMLKEVTIPFMLASMAFYEDILYKTDSGTYMFVPSYSPEIGPINENPLSINATMDVAGLKQLIRNLLELVSAGYIHNDKVAKWTQILANLPDYQIDDKGELKEWLWKGFENDNDHRHASHMYPLLFEVDPEFIDRPELVDAAAAAIESRLEGRRKIDGGPMAFGLVQLGTAAAHINDIEHAYECVEWLCKSYWSPAYTAYHDPGAIFNADISGGLPTVVTEMLVQSSAGEIRLLPTLPAEWKKGKIKGVLTRSGVIIDFEWKDGQVTKVILRSVRDTQLIVRSGQVTKHVEIQGGVPKVLIW